MSELTEIADRVARWTNLGVALPTELVAAIDVFEKLRWLEVGYTPVFNIDEVTVDNAEAKVHEFAEQLALSEVPGGGLSILGKARGQAANEAARRVGHVARSAVPGIIEQLTPTFDQHAETYSNAVAQLPEDISPENLLTAGTEAVEAYHVAQQEARYLTRISAWVVEAGVVSGAPPWDVEKVLRILRPESLLQLSELDAACHKVNRTLNAIDPVFYTAARLGVEFKINTLREAAQLRQSLETIDPQRIQGLALSR